MTSHKKRILQIVPAMSKESGVMRYVWNMLSGSNRGEFKFDFLYHIPSSVTFEKEAIASGSRLIQAPDVAKDPIGYIRYVNSFFREEGCHYAIVHCHVPNTAFCALRAAANAGVECRILHSHLAASSEHMSHRIRNYPLIRYGKRFATHNTACSEEAGCYLFGRKPFQIFRNGIDVDKFRYDEGAARVLKDQLLSDPSAFPVIGCVGRLAKQKNYPFMLKVFQELLKKEGRAEMLIAGSGPEEKRIAQLVIQMGLQEKVHMLGIREDVNKLYSIMDVMAMPSLCEGLPVAAVEAQAAGLRCVFSSDVPAEADIASVSSFVDRNAPLSDWSYALMDLALKGRNANGEKSVVDAGYSLQSSSALLFDFYRSIA